MLNDFERSLIAFKLFIQQIQGVLFNTQFKMFNAFGYPVSPIQTGGGAIVPALTKDVYNFFNKQAKPTKLDIFF